MNRPRSIYRTDFSADAWFENNFICRDEFCSVDNIDDCLKYLSQELSALGYSPIYSNTSSCPYAVNCDIVKLINALFDLLKDLREQIDSKDSAEERNQRLSSDLNTLNKKNSQLNERLDCSERKYHSALENERQLKIKNDSLAKLLKNEKEEVKKLTSQIQHQKLNFQHEIRKYENQLKQMKNRLTQLISDKNPEKKVANISTTHSLSRNSNQRGKWKTDSSAKSSAEEMFNSVLLDCTNRIQIAESEIEQYQQCLKIIENDVLDIISLAEEESFKETLPSLEAILNASDNQQRLKERFCLLLSKLKEIVNKRISVPSPQSDFSNQDSLNADAVDGGKVLKQATSKKQNISETDKENLLSQELAIIKEEKSKLEAQKLEMLNLAMSQKSSSVAYSSLSVPSFAVVTSHTGVMGVPNSSQLKMCLSSLGGAFNSLSPLWKTDVINPNNISKSTPTTLAAKAITFDSPPHHLSESEQEVLPKWARGALTSAKMNCSGEEVFSPQSPHEISVTESISNGDVEASEIESSEEESLAKLRAAMEDLEKKRSEVK